MNPQTRETISKIVSEDNAQDKIIVLGARVNNLKNIDVVISVSKNYDINH